MIIFATNRTNKKIILYSHNLCISVHNGIYTMHTRRNQKMESSENSATVESTSVKLLDDKGQEVEVASLDNQNSEPTDDPEIVHMHKLSVEGEDVRTVDTTGSGRGNYSVTNLYYSFFL